MSVADKDRRPRGVSGLPLPERLEDLVWRVKAQFRAAPRMELTLVQAHYLFDIEATVCQAILELLCAEGFLAHGAEGAYHRSASTSPAGA